MVEITPKVQRAMDLLFAESIRTEINGNMPMFRGQMQKRSWWIKKARKAADVIFRLMAHVDRLESEVTCLSERNDRITGVLNMVLESDGDLTAEEMMRVRQACSDCR